MRLLFTCVGGEGHAGPLAPIARAAAAAGHEVAFAVAPGLVALVEASGFTAFAAGPRGRAVPPGITTLQAPDQEREDRDLRERFAGSFAARRAGQVAELVRAWSPDVVVSDETDFGALAAVESLGRPQAVVQVTASGAFLRPEVLVEPLDRLRAGQGLEPDPTLAMLEGDLLLVPFPPGFRVHWPERAHAVRPGLDGLGPVGAAPAWLDELGDRPVVWLSLGTVFNAESGDLFDRALAGLGSLDVDLVATVGRQLDPEAFGAPPPNVRLVRYVPQAQLLPYVDLVVSHGGSGSVVGALTHGLPMVLLPLGADQLLNGARCRALGLGPVLDVVSLTPTELAEAAMDALADAAAAAASARLRAEIDDLPGPERAVELLAGLRG